MRYLLKPFQWLYCIYGLVLFVGIMLLLFPFMLIASLFGRIIGGNMIYRLCMLWGDIWFLLVFIFHRNIYEQPLDKNKQYIFVGNHISYLDAPMIVKTLRRPRIVFWKSKWYDNFSKTPGSAFRRRVSFIYIVITF